MNLPRTNTKNAGRGAIFLQFAAAVFLLGSVGAHAKTTHYKDVESLMDNVDKKVNKKVHVTGEVEDIRDQRTFALEGGGLTNDKITVVLTKKPTLNLKKLQKADTKVVVEGTVRRGNLSKFESDSKWKFDPKVRREIERAKYYLVADSIRRVEKRVSE